MIPTIPVFDGHNDSLLRILREKQMKSGYSFLVENSLGHLDLPRAQQGGLVGGIFAVFTPTPQDSPESQPGWGLEKSEDGYRQQLNSAIAPEYSRDFSDHCIDCLYELEKDSQGLIRVVTSIHQLTDCFSNGIFAVVLHFEGAEAIQTDLTNLEYFYARGLRSMGIVWSRPNLFAEGVPFAFPSSPDTGPGLTTAGKELVCECNRLGILIDLAHINEKGFWDVASINKAPLVVTHTDVHALLPSTRNITDAQIDAIGATNGVIGLNFEPMQIGLDGKPTSDVPLTALVRHVDYIVNRIGVDHVAFGSDFDGTNMPSELKDAAGYQKLIQALRNSGYHEDDIHKIAWKNWFRVFRDTWTNLVQPEKPDIDQQ